MRAAVAVLALVVAVTVLAVMATRSATPVALEEQVREFTRQLTPGGPYRAPEREERHAVVGAVAAMAAAGPEAAGDAGADARRELDRAGFAVAVVPDKAGHRYLVAQSDPASERSWGLVALPLERLARLIVEVPHPNSDYGTENVGLAVLGALPDAIYLQAGAHRRAAGERADVAHQEDSLFHALAVDLSVRLRLPQLQLHGFGERDELDDDVVISSGPADPEPVVRAVADRLEESGLSVCRAWARRCHGLEGTTNVQAAAADRAGLPFAHVEMSAWVRRSPDALAGALAALGG
ncbi:hypothetical protein GCM10009609_08160 [Pseudonocardia aurantiaca]|uniref:Uncharacterized protein n=1 Tax=Pseudonocardia aurantiaca TaxID=75290 RepID=A0ABW4FMG4_9PSEU